MLRTPSDQELEGRRPAWTRDSDRVWREEGRHHGQAVQTPSDWTPASGDHESGISSDSARYLKSYTSYHRDLFRDHLRWQRTLYRLKLNTL